MPDLPSLVLCPGAWYPTFTMDILVSKLIAKDFKCLVVKFPSIDSQPPIQTMEPDIAAVRDVIIPELDSGKNVVVVVHSWAGLPVNSALHGFSRAERENQGKPGAVLKIIYSNTFLVKEGESLVSTFGAEPPWFILDPQKKTVTPDGGYNLFFHDCEDGKYWESTLRPHAYATKYSRATGAAYKMFPSVYLVCKDDHAIPEVAQKNMIDMAKAAGGKMETVSHAVGHTPYLSQPDFFADFVEQYATKL